MKRTNRQKTERFAAIKDFSNVVEFPDHLRGKWARQYFHNDHPIVLELGCGKGDYTLALARVHPEKNYIGVDLKGERIYIGAKTGITEALHNVAFVRGFIEQLDMYFGPNEISEIWITFPDPFPRKKQAKHRLTAPSFLEMYKTVLIPDGILHLKTDVQDLFTYSIEMLHQADYDIETIINDVYNQPEIDPLLKIHTHFEKKHLAAGKTIYYLRAINNVASTKSD